MKGKKKKKGVSADGAETQDQTETSTEDSVEAVAVEETVEVAPDEAVTDQASSDEQAQNNDSSNEDAQVEEPAEESAAEPAEESAAEPAEESAAEPAEEPAAEPVEEAAAEPAEEAAADPVEGQDASSAENGETDQDAELVVDPESERRQAGRKGVKLNRLIASKVVDGNSHRECYLHLVDISEGGLRVNSDDPFPDDREFTLEIGLAAFGTELATRKPRITFPVRVVWTKSLVGGMVVSGLAFSNLDQESQDIVAAIMQGASPQGRRQHFRLNRVLGVELGAAGNERWLYPLTLDLSVEGMRICLSETLEVGAQFPIRIFLEFELPTVEANSEVMWQEVMPSGRVQVGLKFDGMSERDSMAIKTYIDQCLEQDQSHRNH